MRHAIAVCLVLSLLACRWWPPPTKRHRQIVVFADLTMSLDPDAAANVQKSVELIAANAPGGSHLIIVPICENTRGVRRIDEQLLPAGMTKREINTAVSQRLQLKSDIEALFKEIRGTDAATTAYASCISPGLQIVDNLQRSEAAGTTSWQTDVVFVSDMIEECRSSVLGQPVRLKLPNQQFATACRLVNDNRPLMNLGDVRIVAIFPRGANTGRSKPDEPLPAALQTFWQRLFSRSGVTGTHLWWDAETTGYLNSLHH